MSDNETLVATGPDVALENTAERQAETPLTKLRFRFVQTADKPAHA